MIKKEFLKIIEKIDKNLKNHYSDIYQTDLEIILSRLSKLTEEVGELNSDVLKKFFKKKKFDEENLRGEFSDVIICILLLAKSLDIDINLALKEKLKLIEKRGGI